MSKTRDSFPRFAELPKELRVQIWRYWVSPRLVELPRTPIQHRINQWEADSDRRHVQDLRPDSAVPLALLGVNKESRYEMFLFYHRRFELHRPDDQTTDNGMCVDRPGIAINTNIDTLCFYRDDVNDLVKLCAVDMQSIRYAAMHYRSNLSTGMIAFITDMSTFLALEKLLKQCDKLERVSLFLLDPYSRDATITPRVTQQDEARRAQFEQQFIQHWKNWHTDERLEHGQVGVGLQKKLEDVVRVQFISQLREERGLRPDQRVQFDVDW
jgi:hypothetical protein